MLELTKKEVLELGLKFVKHKHKRQTFKSLQKKFIQYYGAEAEVLAIQWRDLCTTDIPHAKVPEKQQNERGFRMFMMAHYFLFTCPKSTQILAKDFGYCDKNSVSGERLWKWIKRIAALKKKKIVWPHDEFKQDDYAKLVMTVDCVDCMIREPKHPTYNQDSSFSSHKFKKAGLRYELAISVHTSDLIWVNGPYKCGSDADITIFRSGGLKDKMEQLPGKKCIADRGYEAEPNLISIPNSLDEDYVHEFKSRARCRHENFNGRLKKYKTMDCFWEYGIKKHGIAFEAICVTCQYRMENGHPLWDVLV
jgi:hypothetical protein